MVDDTLPPGTTHSDIDKHFGGEEPEEYIVAGDVGFSIKVKDRDEVGAGDRAFDKLNEIVKQHDDLELIEPQIEVIERQ